VRLAAAALAAAALLAATADGAATAAQASPRRTTVSAQSFRAAMDKLWEEHVAWTAFLAHANPKSWPLAATTSMMNDHLKLTTQEAVDELGGHWAKSVTDYDRVENEILMMSKTLADGIIKQFPTRFAV
jgi:hypothetical protein